METRYTLSILSYNGTMSDLFQQTHRPCNSADISKFKKDKKELELKTQKTSSSIFDMSHQTGSVWVWTCFKQNKSMITDTDKIDFLDFLTILFRFYALSFNLPPLPERDARQTRTSTIMYSNFVVLSQECATIECRIK